MAVRNPREGIDPPQQRAVYLGDAQRATCKGPFQVCVFRVLTVLLSKSGKGAPPGRCSPSQGTQPGEQSKGWISTSPSPVLVGVPMQ